MKSRLGKGDSIFRKTGQVEPEASAIRPAAGTSVENKLSVILAPDQVGWLDRLGLEIRERTRKKIRRTELIRGMIAGVMLSGLDLSAFGTEDDLAAEIRARLTR